MLAVQGLYENGIIKIKEPVPNYKETQKILPVLSFPQ
jgi:hypothetical protein